MKTIILDQNWRYLIAEDETQYHLPSLDDSAWLTVTSNTPLSPLKTGQTLWLRCHFEMPPNDECAYWWLELSQAWPEMARLWVNYEELPLPPQFSPAKWEITYAIAMGENVVTLQIHGNISPNLWQAMRCVPYPCA